MKKKITVAISSALILMSGFAMAGSSSDDSGGVTPTPTTTSTTASTTVAFHGSITNAPCSLDPSTTNATVELGSISSHLLESKGTSSSVPFSFKLANCDISTQRNVTVTFDGAADANDSTLLGLTGAAKGAGIVIAANDGKPVTLGKATASVAIQDTDQNLNFTAYLKGDTATIVPGEFKATSNVTFTYS